MTAPEKCPRCDGTGRVWFDDAQLSDMKYQAKCPDCEGEAPNIVAPSKCPKCGAPKYGRYDGHTLYGNPDIGVCNPISYNEVTGEETEIRTDACWGRERAALLAANAELEARLAASVPRDVARLACQMAWGHGRRRFAGAGFAERPVDPRRIWVYGTEADNEGEYREACECAAVVLARAEAEAAKPQTDKEKSDADQT